eukprot:5592105-Pyramimonas_sp.AAC.1
MYTVLTPPVVVVVVVVVVGVFVVVVDVGEAVGVKTVYINLPCWHRAREAGLGTCGRLGLKGVTWVSPMGSRGSHVGLPKATREGQVGLQQGTQGAPRPVPGGAVVAKLRLTGLVDVRTRKVRCVVGCLVG